MKLARRILPHPGLVGAVGVVVFCSMASCRPAVHDTLPAGSGGSGGSGTPTTGSGGGSGGSSSLGGAGGGATATGGSGGSAGSGGSSATGGSAVGGVSGGESGAGGSAGSSTSGDSSGGAGGSGGTSTVADAAVDTVDAPPPPPSRGPTPATPGHNFPFPQNRQSTRCIYPDLYRNEEVQAAYTQWKNDTVTTDGANGFRRVKRPNEPGLEPNSTVSEGIAYGMLLAVYMDDQELFDDLWQYEQKWVDGKTGLMNWYINAAGTDLGSNPSGIGPATDADEDMAFALVQAGEQWGGQGKLGKKYSDIALETIIKVWNNEIYDYKYLLPGAWGDTSTINLSYFAPAYYKLFAKLDTADPSRNWLAMTDTMYGVLNASLNSSNGNTSNGLIPAWCDTGGKPNGGAFGPTGGPSPTNYQYDSCRMPFRIALDYCWNGDTRAAAYLAKTSSFFAGIGATKIVDGYALNGNPQPQYQTGGNSATQSAAFVGPAGVGAMSSSSYQTFVNEAYGVLVTGKALVGGTYYDDSWMAMSLLMMTANFLDYTTF